MQTRVFGHLPDGRTVIAYTLTSPSGASVEILDYGAIIRALHVPDRTGQLADVVLGFDTLDPYLERHPYFGALVGRVAGRIPGGRFSLDGVDYQLPVNAPPYHIHGGPVGLDQHLWSATPLTQVDGSPSLQLATTSPDGDQGYPGNLDLTVTYTWTAEHTLVMETAAATDRATPLNLTQHSYFNLRGEANPPARAHVLEIAGTSVAPFDDALRMLGRRDTITAANDFTTPRDLEAAIPGLHREHGDLYFLRDPLPNDAPRELQFAARLTDPTSGRILTVNTDEDCLQFYTSWAIEYPHPGKSGRPYAAFDGLCFEAENYPNIDQIEGLGDIILHPGKVQRRRTEYAFTTDA